ncbi:Uu.00g036450.m01.CDS01 [Anthostomella pinea]|uniref:Uu.00g036450.m01.CDS01 n=1 Tax=Anthostomella pinea TaxID=933095 RepID=A0AAI8YDJ8_9PEZI|nr:Uu.00g036450.m01.CDS01 [Anthostomella pinea]
MAESHPPLSVQGDLEVVQALPVKAHSDWPDQILSSDDYLPVDRMSYFNFECASLDDDDFGSLNQWAADESACDK